MSNFILRKADISEAQYLSDLAIKSKAHWGYSAEFLESCRPLIYISEKYIQEWPVVVALSGKQITGFYSLKVIDGENRLDNLWIGPEFIKTGAGTKLFEHAVKKARELGWSYFRLAGEPNAVAFYEKLGATLIGEIPSRLKDGRPLPHMEMKF
jgi:GNAT superfamily N-acetyltransferase